MHCIWIHHTLITSNIQLCQTISKKFPSWRVWSNSTDQSRLNFFNRINKVAKVMKHIRLTISVRQKKSILNDIKSISVAKARWYYRQNLNDRINFNFNFSIVTKIGLLFFVFLASYRKPTCYNFKSGT